jgi:Ribonuclease G/E
MTVKPNGGLTRIVDAGIGETREALVDRDRVIALRLYRASDEGRRVRWGEVYSARVRSVDLSRRGAFLELGLKEQHGFLPLDVRGQARVDGRKPRALKDGEGVVVAVSREGARGKNPIVRLLDEPHPGGAPVRLEEPELAAEITGARPAEPAQRALIDAAIDEALARTVPIPGGGALSIEPTAALLAVDVDAGGRTGSKDPEKFALDLNAAAARETARQVRLRSLGGLIAIDFVSMRANASKQQLTAEVKRAFSVDPWGVRLGQLSAFGVFELSRAQLTAPLHEILREADGRPTVETAALETLRAVEREVRVARGRMVNAFVAPEVMAWLDSAVIPWRDQLSSRVGLLWAIKAAPGQPRDKLDVRAL